MVIIGTDDLHIKNGKKDDIVYISIYPLLLCPKVTTEKVTNPNN